MKAKYNIIKFWQFPLKNKLFVTLISKVRGSTKIFIKIDKLTSQKSIKKKKSQLNFTKLFTKIYKE